MKNKESKKLGLPTIILLMTFLILGPSLQANTAIAAQEENYVLLGSLIPFTGPNASWGIRQDRGLQMVIEKINAAGGIKSLGGAKIKMVALDTESKPEVAGMQCEKLIAMPGIVMVTGAVQSPASVVASQVTERAQIPYLDTSGVDPLITSRGFKYVFRTPATIAKVGAMPLTFADAMNKRHKTNFKKVAILCEDTLPGRSMAEALKAKTQELGFELTDYVLYSAATTTDFISVLSRFQAKGVDILVGHNKPADAIQIVRNLKELNYNLAMVGGVVGGYVSSEFLPSVGQLAEGIVIAASESTELKFPQYKQLRKEFEKRYNDKMNTNVLMGWEAAGILKEALERARSKDPKAVAKALREIEIGYGQSYCFQQFGVKFGETGDNLKAAPAIHQIINGVRVDVFPDEVKEKEPLWPKPKFK